MNNDYSPIKDSEESTPTGVTTEELTPVGVTAKELTSSEVTALSKDTQPFQKGK